MSTKSQTPKFRVHHFAMAKQRQQKITMVTAYDYPGGLAADQAGVDAVLVGDSLGTTALGFEYTINVTLDIMIHHASAVRRGVRHAFLICDMPFLTYKTTPEAAILSAGRLVREGGAEAVKIEGGAEVAENLSAIVKAGIPVMGHVGLKPQSVHEHGGYRVQGRNDEAAEKILEDALAIERAGAFSIVLEAIDPALAEEITDRLSIPTIGIGAGRACDGQVLVFTDMLGILPGSKAKFVRQYTDVYEQMVQGIRDYCGDVREHRFPEEKHEY